jgi:putative permease
MSETPTESRYAALSKAILLAASLVVLLWLCYQVSGVLLLFLFTIIFALILNAPTTWLADRKVPRPLAALLVFGVVLGLLGLLGWLAVPRITEQVSELASNLPTYAQNLSKQLSALFEKYPQLQKHLDFDEKSLTKELPSLPVLLQRVGQYSLSALGLVFMLIVLLSMVLYMVIEPRPLFKLYLSLFPGSKREQAARALGKSSKMVIGWMWSNVVVGSLEAVLTAIFLHLMDVPGVWVWAALAFFSELVPKIGPYLMAAPPVLVALAIDPTTALWVALFYLIMNELMGDLVMPRVRSSTMNLHPVSSLFLMLVMASAFGLPGALIATPLTAFIKAFYEEFYLARHPFDEQLDQQVELIMYRRVDTKNSGLEQ